MSYMSFLGGYPRRRHLELREVPADEQARYEAAVAALRVIEAYEYASLGDVYIPAPPDTRWVWDETEDEHRERIKDMPKTVTIPVMFRRDN